MLCGRTSGVKSELWTKTHINNSAFMLLATIAKRICSQRCVIRWNEFVSRLLWIMLAVVLLMLPPQYARSITFRSVRRSRESSSKCRRAKSYAEMRANGPAAVRTLRFANDTMFKWTFSECVCVRVFKCVRVPRYYDCTYNIIRIMFGVLNRNFTKFTNSSHISAPSWDWIGGQLPGICFMHCVPDRRVRDNTSTDDSNNSNDNNDFGRRPGQMKPDTFSVSWRFGRFGLHEKGALRRSTTPINYTATEIVVIKYNYRNVTVGRECGCVLCSANTRHMKGYVNERERL